MTDLEKNVVETPRLWLREAAERDAPFVLELLNSDGFIRNIGDRGVRDAEAAVAYIRDKVIGSYLTHGFGMWVVVERAGGRAVGLAGLVKREGLDTPDVGYALLPGASGKGYAQEAAAAVMRHAREALGIGVLAAITKLDNHASMAVLKKVGFRQDGVIELPGIDEPSTYFVHIPEAG